MCNWCELDMSSSIKKCQELPGAHSINFLEHSGLKETFSNVMTNFLVICINVALKILLIESTWC